jgi:hypothetical protein
MVLRLNCMLLLLSVNNTRSVQAARYIDVAEG